MKVVIDETLCEGHAKCMETVPEVFEVNDDDLSTVLLDTIDESFRERIERAVRVCPRAAISVVDD